MAKKGRVHIRIDTDVKTRAEKILDELGITPSQAVNMFYKSIIFNNGLPFETKIPNDSPKSSILVS